MSHNRFLSTVFSILLFLTTDNTIPFIYPDCLVNRSLTSNSNFNLPVHSHLERYGLSLVVHSTELYPYRYEILFGYLGVVLIVYQHRVLLRPLFG